MGRGLAVIDVSDTSNPEVVSWLSLPEATYSYLRYDSQIYNTNYLFMTVEEYASTIPGGLICFDISDPLNITITDKLDAWPAGDLGSIFYSSCFRMDITGTTCWLCSPDDDVEMMKVDISDVNNLSISSRHRPDYTDPDGSHNSTGNPGSFFWRGARDVSIGSPLDVTTGWDLWHVDASNPSNDPPTIWEDVNAHAVVKVGSVSYILVSGDYPNTFKKVTGMSLNAQILVPISTTVESNFIKYNSGDGYIYVSTASALHTVSTTPTLVNSESIHARGVTWDGNDMFVAGLDEGLYIYDNSDPTSPSEITQYLPWY
jgi:hypothetical protein